MAPVAEPLRDNVPALQIGFGSALADTPVGTVAVTTTADVDAVAVPHTLVADKVYTPAFPAITPFTDVVADVGLAIAVPPGPDHE